MMVTAAAEAKKPVKTDPWRPFLAKIGNVRPRTDLRWVASPMKSSEFISLGGGVPHVRGIRHHLARYSRSGAQRSSRPPAPQNGFRTAPLNLLRNAPTSSWITNHARRVFAAPALVR